MNRLHRQASGRAPVLFLSAAVLVRSLDSAATVAVILVAMERAPGTDPVRTGALIGAALTLPHLLGPWVGSVTSAISDDSRRVIAGAALCYSSVLTGITILIGRAPLPLLLVLAAVAGLVGPLLTGGLSGRAGETLGGGRRAQSLDALSYGLAATVGPSAVAGLAVALDPMLASLIPAGAGAVGGLVVLRLPPTGARPADPTSSATLAALRLMAGEPRLRAAVGCTWIGALLVSASLIAAMARFGASAPHLTGYAAGALGAGGLIGSAVLIARPPSVRVVGGMLGSTAAICCCLLVTALAAPGVALLAMLAVLGLVNAVQTVLSLSARQELSPARWQHEVFVAVAGTKVAFAALGTAVAGASAGSDPRILLAVLAVVGMVTVIVLWGSLQFGSGGRPVSRMDRESAI